MHLACTYIICCRFSCSWVIFETLQQVFLLLGTLPQTLLLLTSNFALLRGFECIIL